MIPELFLSCALALPMSMAPNISTKVNPVLVKFLIKQERLARRIPDTTRSKVYLVGGSDNMARYLREGPVDIYRMTILEPHKPFDIIAFPNAIPFASESALIVVYMWQVYDDPWISMRLFAEAFNTLEAGGLLVFVGDEFPRFDYFAYKQGFKKIERIFSPMEIWRKPGKRFIGKKVRALFDQSA